MQQNQDTKNTKKNSNLELKTLRTTIGITFRDRRIKTKVYEKNAKYRKQTNGQRPQGKNGTNT